MSSASMLPNLYVAIEMVCKTPRFSVTFLQVSAAFVLLNQYVAVEIPFQTRIDSFFKASVQISAALVLPD